MLGLLPSSQSPCFESSKVDGVMAELSSSSVAARVDGLGLRLRLAGTQLGAAQT